MEDAAAAATRWDSLDGVRALAVIVVVATHFGLHATQGQIGVDVFFVLSGFLITSLLLKERDRTNRVSLTNFWRRRALRLLPALGCAIVLAVAVSLTALPAMRHSTIRLVPFVLAYAGNWAVVFGPPHAGGLLAHTWSLAVEEQFYIVWPLLGVAWLCVTADRRRAARIVGAVAVADALYFVLALANWAPGRAIFATDTHAFGLLTGSALALWVHRDGPVTLAQDCWRRRVQAAGGISALLIVGLACFGRLDLVILPATAAAAALVASLVLVPAGSLVRVFAWSPMRWIGRRSYGIYLYHFPLAVAFVGERHLHGLHYAVAVTVCVAGSLLLAAASYRWVETPFLRRKDRLGTAPVPAVALQPVRVGALP
jgi:peptidoglycan/LPS O-acetylase OafA/YrhL